MADEVIRDIAGDVLKTGLYFRIDDVFGTDIPSLVYVIEGSEGKLSYVHLVGNIRPAQVDDKSRFYRTNDSDLEGISEKIQRIKVGNLIELYNSLR